MAGTGQSRPWWVLTWLLRVGILAAIYGAWQVRWGLTHDWKWPAACLTVAVILFGAQWVARRQALGWIVDSNGERQKVESWNRGSAVFRPTTRGQRIVEEAAERDTGRRQLFWYGAPGWAMAAFTYYLYPGAANSDPASGGYLLPGLIAFGFLVPWFCFLFLELLYLSGWQDMKGAQVLDSEPPRPGLDDVYQQKAHGRGRVATEEEAVALLNPKP
jgi:hypothetical protein